MSKKRSSDTNGFVFSTNPDFRFQHANNEQAETAPAAQQKLRIRLETKHRGGKTATVITGFTGKEDDLEGLGKALRNACGTGGSAKDGEIIIQGDQRDKVLQWLLKAGYGLSKKA